MRYLRSIDPGFEAAFAAFLAAPRGQPADVDAAVAEILEGVRTGGVEALLDYARRFDRVELTIDTLRVTADEIAAGVAATVSAARLCAWLRASMALAISSVLNVDRFMGTPVR